MKGLPARWRQIRAAPTRHLRRHADALAQRGVRVNRLADVHRISTHLDRQRNLANHVAGVGTNHATAQYLAVALGLKRIVKQQLGDAFVAAIGNRATGSRPSRL